MSWFSKFLTSSLGQKFVMSLTGLFLMLFLIIHLIGNLQLLKADGGEAFNTYAYFMTHNPLIKVVSYTLYASILLHAIQGILLWQRNKAARGDHRYAVQHARPSERPARNMAWLGIVIFVFIVLHMYQFWFQMHWGPVPFVEYESYPHPVRDLYSLVNDEYNNIAFVVFYVISMIVVGVHLRHGFWSAFQTLGVNQKKYTPLIHTLGFAYAVIVPALFALIPVWMFIDK
jgi:succinate dehydrogenase / fumarate reductase, cytochrome b subunit